MYITSIIYNHVVHQMHTELHHFYSSNTCKHFLHNSEYSAFSAVTVLVGHQEEHPIDKT